MPRGLVAGCALLAWPALAAEVGDVAAGFEVDLWLLFAREGEFRDVAVSVSHPEDPSLADVRAVIRAASAVMPDPGHTMTLRSPEFFDAERHPEIVFSARSVPMLVLQHGGRMEGTLTLRGQTRPVTWTLAPLPCRGAAPCGFRGQTTVDRTSFGMTSKRAVLSRKVRVWIEVRLLPREP